MKPESDFVAQRALARHCPELVRPAPEAGELLARLDAVGEVMAAALCRSLTPLFGYEAPHVACEPASECGTADLAGHAGPLAASSLMLAGKDKVPVLATLDGPAILRMVDRAFGGKGIAPNPLPEALPLSAQLMIARLESLTMAAIDQAWGIGLGGQLPVAQRSVGKPDFAPFPDAMRLAAQRIVVTEAGGARWPISLALPLNAVAAMIGNGGHSASAERPSRPAVNPAEDPYGGLPFTIRAVLVDMAMPVSTISTLSPGQVLPVSVARSVPLHVGGRAIAHGTIGALDENVAVQISHAF